LTIRVIISSINFCLPPRELLPRLKKIIIIVIIIDNYSRLASTHIFYPFAIETAGTWHEMAIELTQEIGRRITTMAEDTRVFFLFQRLYMALQRGEQFAVNVSHSVTIIIITILITVVSI